MKLLHLFFTYLFVWIVALLMLLHLASCEKPTPQKPLPPPQPPVQVGTLSRGLTLDSVEELDAILWAIKSMAWRPSVRVVCDVPKPPSEYKKAIDELAKVSEVIIQISDSHYSRQLTPEQFEQRTREYLEAFPQVNIYETSNEINMCDGCDPVKDSARFAEQARRSMLMVKHFGKKSMVTPYWNVLDCADNNGEYKAWLKNNLSEYVKQNADYVALSIYGMDCGGRPEPSYSELDTELDALQKIFPSAQVMIGEYGADRAREKRYNIKDAEIIRHYIGYHRDGAGLYWYGYQAIIDNADSWKAFNLWQK